MLSPIAAILGSQKHPDMVPEQSSLPLSRLSSLSNRTLYDSSFAVRGPKLWNKVPVNIKAEATFESFKVSLSKFIALIPDNPPISGYSCSWSNSLVDYSPSRWSEI